MRSAPYDLSVSPAWADALFASALQRSDEPSARQIEQAVAVAIGTLGELGCAARVAQAYGEHPETAVARMRWARSVVSGAFDPPPSASALGLRPGQYALPLDAVPLDAVPLDAVPLALAG